MLGHGVTLKKTDAGIFSFISFVGKTALIKSIQQDKKIKKKKKVTAWVINRKNLSEWSRYNSKYIKRINSQLSYPSLENIEELTVTEGIIGFS